MGAKPADIEREIAQQRELITRKLQHLEGRVRTDMTTARERVAGQAGETKEKLQLQERVRRHPRSYVTGAFAVGVLLGILSDGLGGSAEEQRRSGPDRARRDDAGGGAGLLGAVLGTVQGPVQEEVRQLVRQAMAGFADHAQERSPARRDGSSVDEQEQRQNGHRTEAGATG